MDLLDPLNVRLPESIARPFDFQCSSTTHLQHFPADELCSLETLSVLRRLGLRNALDRDGVLDAARSIADYRALETRNVGESDLMKRACVYSRTSRYVPTCGSLPLLICPGVHFLSLSQGTKLICS